MNNFLLILKFIGLFFTICGGVWLMNIPFSLMSEANTAENVLGYFLFVFVPTITITLLVLEIKNIFNQLKIKK